ncbi:MAG: 3-oxoacyl-ACP synthase [candidate division KSB1 bacterium]|nr:3-oxoacyl-ACP synthase [candidate division KSB1 bacterium]MDZ7275673.1 3-oxoacyl-ACP synthase [candidate division KSB1 bacterium]MDZ7284636.1 3-oxoacyl-ACP synthase [candidate division KSB1 bacterium]MDZ7297945.1 3-oxoacyl-ACP synthase [candidate division KSB1 bacterium]MDZ7308326.1 3-oxoacyl-ACP synthase [candidate division KSB1 bacterium]
MSQSFNNAASALPAAPAGTVPVGIVSAGMHLPAGFLTAADIAAQSGLPEWVVRDKLGIHKKYIAGADDHPNDMALAAARDCLARAAIPASEIDLVLCTTEEWKEYAMWTAGIDLAHRLGAPRAWAIDLHMRCCTTIAAIKIACDLMACDDSLHTVLIAGGYNVSRFVNFKNPRTSFLFNLGAGAGALLLRKHWPRNRVLGAHLLSDGSMSRHVIVPASGTREHPSDAAVAAGRFYFDLVEPEAMKNRLNEVSMHNWLTCIDEALRKSSRLVGRTLTRRDIGFLNMILVKPSAHREMLQHLGLQETQSVYLAEYGHIGEQDNIIAIREGEKQGRLRDGDLMVMVGAGIGYVWGAACVRWGPL